MILMQGSESRTGHTAGPRGSICLRLGGDTGRGASEGTFGGDRVGV